MANAENKDIVNINDFIEEKSKEIENKKDKLDKYDINFPENYPESPPQILFITPIYHLNVNSSSKSGIPLGTIYCNSLNYWKNYYTIKKVIPEIFVLLYKNNPDCGYDLERNEEFQNNRELFEEKAKFFTKKYAKPMVCSEFRYKKVLEWDFSKSI